MDALVDAIKKDTKLCKDRKLVSAEILQTESYWYVVLKWSDGSIHHVKSIGNYRLTNALKLIHQATENDKLDEA